MSRRNKKFVTGFTIVMIVFSIGFSIPSIIEAFNIARNIEQCNVNDQEILPNSYEVLKWKIEDGSRFSGYIRAYNDSIYPYHEQSIVFAIMNEAEFTNWYDLGENVPNILNTTYLFNSNDIRIDNLAIENTDDYFEDSNEYYLVFYNSNSNTTYVNYDFEILPWGHIIATSIVGFGFAICFLGLLTKIGFTTYFVLSDDKKPKVLTVQSQNNSEPVLQPDKDENFCVSCGAPMTKKDGRYCSNCGSSI